MSETEKTLAAAYCSANGIKDTPNILNVCEQIDDISYIEIDANPWDNREEKLGYTIIEETNPELKTTLEQCKLGNGMSAYDYFDFEKYGHDLSINNDYFATNKIFILYTADINTKQYTTKEIKEQLHDPRL